jgi:hypothetical protein
MAYKIYKKPFQRADGKWLLSDLYAAAFLNAVGHEVVDFEEVNADGRGPRPVFVFSDSDSFQSDYERFTVGEEIGIRKFLDAVYDLKGLAKRHGLFRGN